MVSDGENSKDRIISAAIEAFAAGAYEGTSIRDVASAAGVSLPVIYYYFKSKEGLYDYIMQHCRVAYLERVQAATSAEGDLRSKLVGLIRARQDLATSHRPIVILLTREQFSIMEWSREEEEYSPTLSVTFEVLQELLNRSISSGEIPDQNVDSAAWALVGILGILDLQTLSRRQPAEEAEIERTVNLAMKALK